MTDMQFSISFRISNHIFKVNIRRDGCKMKIIDLSLGMREWGAGQLIYNLTGLQPTPACLPGEFRGQRNLAAYSPRGQ